MRSQYCHCPPVLPSSFRRCASPLHVSLDRKRFQGQNMQTFKVLQRPLCV
ncbi:hypothetical protein SF83666_b55180 (plasmid) [Sinorhizobium fredii CCBAU 83666]|nr:hypothetical protein SF83666_b55180 [Sinorhizobium fredii CCBAU 83666]